MRIPLGATLESRDGTIGKGAYCKNCIVENNADGRQFVMKRPGVGSALCTIRSGTIGLAYWFQSNIISAIAGRLDKTPSPFSAASNIGNFGATITITRSGSTATATTTGGARHGLLTGDSVTVSGANQTDYNGTFTVTVTTVTSFTYTVANNPTTPATGTITFVPVTSPQLWTADNGLSGASGYMLIVRPSSTCAMWRLKGDLTTFNAFATGGVSNNAVAGVVFLDGYFFVMDVVGNVCNTTLNADPLGDGFSNSIAANKDNGAGVFLGKTHNYIVAFKEFSTEFFYDAGNATGSPLAPVENGFIQIGCASADSVKQMESSLFFIGQRSKGRGIFVLDGLNINKVSTPDVDRILDADSLATVRAMVCKLYGHRLYILTLEASGITLVYDVDSQTWLPWSGTTLVAGATVSSITRSGTTATVTTSSAHGLSDGDPMSITGANQAAYNGLFQVQYVSTTQFTYQVSGSPATPATGSLSLFTYSESYFPYTKYVNGGKDLLIGETSGHLCEISSASAIDEGGLPINVNIRTSRLDGGDSGSRKLCGSMTLEGDAVSDTMMVRYTNDDYATFSAYQIADLSLKRPIVRKCGSFKRRANELRYIGTNALRLLALEADVT